MKKDKKKNEGNKGPGVSIKKNRKTEKKKEKFTKKISFSCLFLNGWFKGLFIPLLGPTPRLSKFKFCLYKILCCKRFLL